MKCVIRPEADGTFKSKKYYNYMQNECQHHQVHPRVSNRIFDHQINNTGSSVDERAPLWNRFTCRLTVRFSKAVRTSCCGARASQPYSLPHDTSETDGYEARVWSTSSPLLLDIINKVGS